MLSSVKLPSYPEATESVECYEYRTDHGWRIEVHLPEGLSASDRREILRWLRSHQSDLLRQHPYWATRLTGGGNYYLLEIIRGASPQERILNQLHFIEPQPYGEVDYA